MTRLLASRSVARWAPATLFALVALVHLQQNRTANLNPWLGGGFGMFSTNDQPWPHSISIDAEDESGKLYFVEWSPQSFLSAQFQQLQVLYAQPSVEGLSVAATYALDSRRTGNGSGIRQVLSNLRTTGALDRVTLRENADELSKTETLRVQSARDEPSGLVIVHATARAWRLRFDSDAARFFSEPNGQPGEAHRQP